MNLIKRFFGGLSSLLFDSIVRLLASEKSPLTIKMAARNIERHRGKSLIIGSILFLGAFLMTVGNGVISGMNVGLQKNIVEGFSGDVILVSDKQESDNLFMDPMGKALDPINNYKSIDTVLKSVSLVKKWLPVGKNFAMALNEDGGLADGVFVLGVDMKKYRDFFGDNLKVVEGRLLDENESGVLVPTGWRKAFAEFYNIILTPDSLGKIDTADLGKDVNAHLSTMSRRTNVIYMGMSADNATTDIRVPVRGIVKYRSLNTIWGQFPIVDIESYRECQGYFSALSQNVEVKKETADLLGQSDESLDDMFSDDNMVVASSGTSAAAPAELAEGSLRVEKTRDLRAVDLEAGTFNLVLLRLAPGMALEKAAAELNKTLKDKKLGVRAVVWKKAIGPLGSMAVLIKTSLFVFVMLLFFVAIIIIINTLSMAALERTTEIGMMRAVGAQKGFIRAMFIGETGMLSAVFGGMGIVLGIIVINVIGMFNITTTQDMLQLLYGGDAFKPLLSVTDIALAIVQLVIVTLIAVIYPVKVASGITPLDAIFKGIGAVMPVVVDIALRNLVRQKRRNLLLGIAIAFGALVLILTNAFSHGITKVLFERIVKYTNGHVAVSFMKNGNMMNQVFHDGDMMKALLTKNAPEAPRLDEAIGVFGRALGNGTADNVMLVGVDLDGKMTPEERKEYESNFKFLEGSFDELKDGSRGIPVALAESKAKYLKVKMGDVIKVRFTGVNNQSASAKLTVVAIFKPANVFMAMPVFLNLKDVRTLAGYGPHDVATIQLNMADPQKNAKKVADRIYHALHPGIAVIEGTAVCKGVEAKDAMVLGFKNDSASRATLMKNVLLAQGDSAKAYGSEGVILSAPLAKAFHANVGDTVTVLWRGKYDTSVATARFVIGGVAAENAPVPNNALIVNDRDFYRWYYMPLPPAPSAAVKAVLPDSSVPLYKALAPEYTLMKRVATSQEYMKAFREVSQQRVRGVVVSVQSMYETASMIIQIEFVLFIITLVVCVILFVIILIGVINTLRMTIRERTREIGTVRAIGMQKNDVLRIFLFETGFLALFSSLAGAALAFLAMWGLSSIPINAGENPMGMLLVNGRLFFAPTILATAGFILFIVGITLVTAWFPSRRASNLSAANAMRHYE